jgi:hypothetical protein
MKTFHFRLAITLPDGVTEADAREYIHSAVKSMGGCHHPEDPFFGLDDEDVEVVRLPPQHRPWASEKKKA